MYLARASALRAATRPNRAASARRCVASSIAHRPQLVRQTLIVFPQPRQSVCRFGACSVGGKDGAPCACGAESIGLQGLANSSTSNSVGCRLASFIGTRTARYSFHSDAGSRSGAQIGLWLRVPDLSFPQLSKLFEGCANGSRSLPRKEIRLGCSSLYRRFTLCSQQLSDASVQASVSAGQRRPLKTRLLRPR